MGSLDKNDDGTLDAAGTEVLESLDTDQLSIGGSSLITDNDVHVLHVIPYNRDSIAVSSTSYTLILSSVNHIPAVDWSEIDSALDAGTLKMKFGATLHYDSAGETITARLGSDTSMEISHTGTGYTAYFSQWSDGSFNSDRLPNVEAKVSAGSGDVYAPSIMVGVQL